MRATEILLELARTTINARGRVISADPDAIQRFWAWFGNSKAKDRQGRPLVVFHGTAAEFRSFDPDKSGSNTGTGTPRGAFVFTDSPEVAESYMTKEGDRKDFARKGAREEYQELIRNGSFDQQLQFLHDNPLVPSPIYKDSGNIMPCYLRMMKPLRVDAKGYHWHDIYFQPKDYRSPEPFTTNEIAEYAMKLGYDGVIIKNVKDVHKGPAHLSTVYFVFSPAQIKSAIGNRGSYSADAKEIDEDV
jgi:hypothetical protein